MKPSSPIPWEEKNGYVVDKLGNIVISPGYTDPEDRDFIVHAANLYPQMVDMLRQSETADDAEGQSSCWSCQRQFRWDYDSKRPIIDHDADCKLAKLLEEVR